MKEGARKDEPVDVSWPYAGVIFPTKNDIE